MTSFSRRMFLGSAAAVSAGFLGLRRFALADLDEEALAGDGDGYGPILPDPDEVLSLPQGFSYKIISRLGDRMDDGFRPGQSGRHGLLPRCRRPHGLGPQS